MRIAGDRRRRREGSAAPRLRLPAASARQAGTSRGPAASRPRVVRRKAARESCRLRQRAPRPRWLPPSPSQPPGSRLPGHVGSSRSPRARRRSSRRARSRADRWPSRCARRRSWVPAPRGPGGREARRRQPTRVPRGRATRTAGLCIEGPSANNQTPSSCPGRNRASATPTSRRRRLIASASRNRTGPECPSQRPPRRSPDAAAPVQPPLRRWVRASR